MVFVDSNVPMYLVGGAHPARDRLASHIRAAPNAAYVTSVEVYQEIIHRYVAIDRREAIADAFDLLDALVERVFAIEESHVRAAHEVALDHRRLSGRDCLHVAVMRAHRIDRILSMDRGFDFVGGIVRLP